MILSKKILEESADITEAFVMASMMGERWKTIPYFDTYHAPFFTFSDGSILEFTVDYQREVLSARDYTDMGDLIENGMRFDV